MCSIATKTKSISFLFVVVTGKLAVKCSQDHTMCPVNTECKDNMCWCREKVLLVNIKESYDEKSECIGAYSKLNLIIW